MRFFNLFAVNNHTSINNNYPRCGLNAVCAELCDLDGVVPLKIADNCVLLVNGGVHCWSMEQFLVTNPPKESFEQISHELWRICAVLTCFGLTESLEVFEGC